MLAWCSNIISKVPFAAIGAFPPDRVHGSSWRSIPLRPTCVENIWVLGLQRIRWTNDWCSATAFSGFVYRLRSHPPASLFTSAEKAQVRRNLSLMFQLRFCSKPLAMTSSVSLSFSESSPRLRKRSLLCLYTAASFDAQSINGLEVNILTSIVPVRRTSE